VKLFGFSLHARSWGIVTLLMVTLLYVGMTFDWRESTREIDPQHQDLPKVIGAGNESLVLSMLRPHALGEAVEGDWRLSKVWIDRGHVDVMVRHDTTKQTGVLRLLHPTSNADRQLGQSESFIFALTEPSSAESRDALIRIVDQIKKNDDGSFWFVVSQDLTMDMRGNAKSSLNLTMETLGKARSSFNQRLVHNYLRVIVVISTLLLCIRLLWLPSTLLKVAGGVLSLSLVILASSQSEWFSDVVVFIFALSILSVGVVWRSTREDSYLVWGLIGVILVLSIGLRLLLSEPNVMGAWPFERYYEIGNLLLESQIFLTFTQMSGMTFHKGEVISGLSFYLSVITVVSVYGHARFLTGDPRSALVAMLIFGFLPSHIRFAASEVAFIPSLAISTTTFALSHVAMKDQDRYIRWAVMILLPAFSAMLITVRPLNVLFVLLFVMTALYLERGKAPLSRAGWITFLTGGVGSLVGFVFLQNQHAEQLSIDNIRTALIDGFYLIFDVESNTLINPYVTPLVVTVLALVGLVHLLKTKRKVAWYLAFWIAAFFITHAIIIPSVVESQARYHLHLIVPFSMLAGCGWLGLLSTPRLVRGIVVGLVSLSPVFNQAFIRNVGFNQMNEYAFIKDLNSVIPDGCLVLEPLYRDDAMRSSRMKRLAMVARDGVLEQRFDVLGVYLPRDSHRERQENLQHVFARVGQSDGCVYFYRGMACHISDSRVPGSDCHALGRAFRWTEEQRASYPNRVYDLRTVDDPMLELSLHRLNEAVIGEPLP